MQFQKADKIFLGRLESEKKQTIFTSKRNHGDIKYFLVYYAERIYERSMFIDKERDWKQFVLLLICLGAFAGKT